MNRHCIAFIVGCLSALAGTRTLAQTAFIIKGHVRDTTTDFNLANAAVAVLNAKDSTLAGLGWTSREGRFVIGNLRAGKYILQVSFPDYADLIRSFEMTGAEASHDLGELNLSLKAQLLKEVVIKGQTTLLKINGDTTEYNAKALKIGPNDKVEDLLKQIPGMQVDQDGRITAYGKAVKKVLVEGEEFFGDDPTLVTRNLRGDMVARIQLYDKKSEKAELTGADDGERTKTINIKLKEDKKNGYFGNGAAGAATHEYHQEQAMFNRFRDKRKVALYANGSNTGKTGLSSSDNDKYGMTGSSLRIFMNGIISSAGSADEQTLSGENYSGEGIPFSRTAGAHADSKWNQDKETVNVNYKIGTLDVQGSRSSLSQIDLPNDAVRTISDQNFTTDHFVQKLDGNYQFRPSPSATLSITVDGGLKRSKTQTDFLTFARNADGILLNQSNRMLSNDADQKILSSALTYRKRLKKRGRSFSLGLSQSAGSQHSDGLLKAANNFFSASGLPDSTHQIDQSQTRLLNNNLAGGTAGFTEPLSKKLNLTGEYALGVANTSSVRRTLNRSAGGNYDQFDPQFSNDFHFNELTNRFYTELSYGLTNQTISLSGAGTVIHFSQLDRSAGNRLNRDFLSISPRASYFRNYPGRGYLSLLYFARTILPTIEQLQPLRINNDPLNILLGNPDVRPAFSNRFAADYSLASPANSQSLAFNAAYMLINKPIVSAIDIDAAGKTIIRPVNLKGKNQGTLTLNASFSRKLKRPYITVGFDPAFSHNINYGYSNGTLNKRLSSIYSGSAYLSALKPNRYNFSIRISPQYTSSISALKSHLDNSGFGLIGNVLLSLQVASKTAFSWNAYYNYQGKTAAFNRDLNVFMLNVSASRKLLKQQNLKVTISGNDLLNQNRGFNRLVYGTTISESSYTTIRRYFMCSFSWDFSKFGTFKN